MLANLIMFLCRIHYKKYGKAIFYIKGTGKDFPRYLLYTEDYYMYKKFGDVI